MLWVQNWDKQGQGFRDKGLEVIALKIMSLSHLLVF